MSGGKREWMLGLPGHNSVISLDEVLLLVKGGQLRPTDLVKKLGAPWRAANEVPELAEYFSDTPKVKEPVKPATSVPPPRTEPPKPTTRIGTLEPARAAPRRETRAIRRPETNAGAATDVIPKTSEAEAKKPEPPAETPAPPKATRPIPKPPPREIPRLEPMVAKYFSPVDMLRAASYSFEPKKLLLTGVLTSVLAIAWSFLMYFSGDVSSRGEKVAYLAGVAVTFLGLAFILTALAFVTRRQLEGKEYGLLEAIGFMRDNATTALVYPMLVAIPSLLSVGILWILGLLRNASSFVAGFLKIVYIVPMFFGLVFVMGALAYQLASMYVPAAAAIEGQGLSGAVNSAWNNITRQWGRVVLHWLIVTVAFGMIGAVCVGLALLAPALPEIIFGPPTDNVAATWYRFGGMLMSLYRGLAIGLGFALPVSLLSTLGALSYMSLRHPGGAQLAPAPPEETSHDALAAAKPAATPLEATHPAETRPAPADYDGADSKPAPPPPSATNVVDDGDSDEPGAKS